MRRAAAPAWFLLALASGCAGARARIEAGSLDHPVSLTRAVYDSSARVVVPTEVLGHFAFRWRSWSIFWGEKALGEPARDISAELEREIAALSGDAIVNLTVAAEDHPLLLPALLVPLVPTAVTVIVEGDVVSLPQPSLEP